MTPVAPMSEMALALAALSDWIDAAPANQSRPHEAQLWGRCVKVAEEAGEVVAALIGATGQNPRKGVTHGVEDIEKELLDVAVSALTAVEHLTGNAGSSIYALHRHLAHLKERARI